MRQDIPADSQKLALRLGYRLRWLYLVLVVFGWIAWLGMYPAQVWWKVFFEYGVNPVLEVMNSVVFFWTGEDKWLFHYDDGMDGIWGWPRDWSRRYGSPLYARWLWWGAGGIGLPLVLMFSVMGFVGFMPVTIRRLPAKRRVAWMAMLFSSCVGAMAIGGGVLMAMHYSGLLKMWAEWAAVNRTGQSNLINSNMPLLLHWPPEVLWVLIGSIFPAALLIWFGVVRRDRYWRLERITRYVGLGAAIVFVASLIGGLHNRWAWGYNYWALGIGSSVWPTVWFSSSTALLWAVSCRVWLLFRLTVYQRQRIASMIDSPECFACEYDLTGSLRGCATRCPECGVAVPAQVIERFGQAILEKEAAGIEATSEQ
ncbi:MAG: hypothetical protein AAGA25_17245 [Planctomycetota bacterium]